MEKPGRDRKGSACEVGGKPGMLEKPKGKKSPRYEGRDPQCPQQLSGTERCPLTLVIRGSLVPLILVMGQWKDGSGSWISLG